MVSHLRSGRILHMPRRNITSGALVGCGPTRNQYRDCPTRRRRDVDRAQAVDRPARRADGAGCRDRRGPARRDARAGAARRPHRGQRPGVHRRRATRRRSGRRHRRSHHRGRHRVRRSTRLRGPSTVVVDAAGGTVVPGFNDSHVHFLSGSLSLTELDLGGAAHPRRGAAAHPRLRRQEPVGAVDPRPRVELLGVPGRLADARAARCRAVRSPGHARLLRRPQLLGEQPRRWRPPGSPGTRPIRRPVRSPATRPGSPTAC